MFIELISFFVIITIHELGHFIAARYYKWNITRLMIWPFGGVMETDDFYNRPSKEEFVVTIAGPLQHIWIFIVLGIMYFIQVQHVLLDQLLIINTIILFFNLIPVLPLDGGRMVFILLTKVTAFHRAVVWMSISSITIIGVINVILWLMQWTSIHLTFLSIFLLLDNWLLWRNKHIILLKHLLARYFISDIEQTNIAVLRAASNTPLSELVKHFKKEYYHYIYLDHSSKPLPEDACLHAMFTRNEPFLTVASIQAREA
ncbi:site-2 protease family protein [Filobacillus milosensis]|nr:site-2 protease family protein [Filobacillus milosensis]